MSLVSGDYGSGSDNENSIEEIKTEEMVQPSPDKKRPRGKINYIILYGR